jgi:hypothetical protein
MSAAIMTMKRATTVADFISYSETLTAPRRGPREVATGNCAKATDRHTHPPTYIPCAVYFRERQQYPNEC